MSELSLTPEQAFAVAKFKLQIQSLTREEAQQRLVAMYEEWLKRSNEYEREIGQRWGITSEP